ncbi:MAG TPA: DMT family transporter [Vicinamibacteria bacterium]|nr:DMT family transporter [Vicinamibacteria bacterium]
MSGAPADDKAAGIASMVLAIASLSFMDALGKRVAGSYSVFQMLAIRSTVALALLALALGLMGRLGTLRTRQPGGHALRSLCGLVAFVSFYSALRYLPLADAVAIAFGSPFLVTALGRFVLHEPVRLRQWLAIVVGFLGMLLIVRPGASGVRPAALLVFVSGLAYALMMVLTRWMTRPQKPHESSAAFVFYMLLGQAAAGWLVAAGRWRTPDRAALAEMAAMGVLGILGNYGLAQAFRQAPVAVVAPFEYTGLIWAVALGALLFGELPPPSFWAGAAVIVAAGLYTARSEAA